MDSYTAFRKRLESAVKLFEKADGLISVWLVGGFGRNEGLLDEAGRPFNDIDFYCVGYPGQLEELQRSLEKVFESTVDISCGSLKAFSQIPPTQFFFDLVKSGRCLYSSYSKLHSNLPSWSAKDIPLFEGRRLLCNRLALLSLPNRLLQDPHVHSKVFLGLLDAWLLLTQHYSSFLREKFDLVSHAPFSADLLEEIQRALLFKLYGLWQPSKRSREELERLVALGSSTLLSKKVPWSFKRWLKTVQVLKFNLVRQPSQLFIDIWQRIIVEMVARMQEAQGRQQRRNQWLLKCWEKIA